MIPEVEAEMRRRYARQSGPKAAYALGILCRQCVVEQRAAAWDLAGERMAIYRDLLSRIPGNGLK